MSAARVRRGQGRIEFLANLPQIQELRRAGNTATMAYEVLKSKGKLTLSYKQFWKYWGKLPEISRPSEVFPPLPPAPAFALPETPESTVPALPPVDAAPPAAAPRKRGRPSKRQKEAKNKQSQYTPPAIAGDVKNFDPQIFIDI